VRGSLKGISVAAPTPQQQGMWHRSGLSGAAEDALAVLGALPPLALLGGLRLPDSLRPLAVTDGRCPGPVGAPPPAAHCYCAGSRDDKGRHLNRMP